MIPRKYNKNKNFKTLILILQMLTLNSCHSALLDPKGQIALEQRSLIFMAFALMLIVVIPAIIMTVLFAWKYRASNVNSNYQPNWSYSNKIELVIWIIPIIIIICLGIKTWKSTHELEPKKAIISKLKPIEIDVIALDWKWLFIYPKEHIATINEIVFPANTPIYFKVTSNTVMNAFFIPTLGSQIYAMAGMQTNLNLIANQPGTFKGIAASYSGRGFSGMKFKAIATINNQQFNQWIKKVKSSSVTLENMDDFESLAAPTINHPVEYFSNVNSTMFSQVMNKFGMHHGHNNMHHEHDAKMSHSNFLELKR